MLSGQLIVYKTTARLPGYETAVQKARQVVRRVRLRQARNLHNLGDAERAGAKSLKNGKSGRVSQTAEKLGLESR